MRSISADTVSSSRAGNINILTKKVIIRDGSTVSAVARLINSREGGNIIINASDSIEVSGFRPLNLSPSAIDTESTGTGDAGNISIDTDRLIVNNGAEITASTIGEGAGGTIDIFATDSVTVSGSIPNSGFRSKIESVSQGFFFGQGINDAGDVAITTKSLLVRDSGQISVSASGNPLSGTGSAGNLEINADLIELDNFGTLNAQTSGGQGDIILFAKDIILRNRSNIITDASGSSSGGNINIDTENLVAFPNENSDISANAENSFGGRVSITADGIFGTEFRDEPTPQSDITATSELGPEFSGEVTINTPEVDPSSGLIELPETVGDPSDQISQNPCEQGIGSEFIITGKGGLPPNPNETLNSNRVRVGLVDPVPLEQKEEIRNTSLENTTPEALPVQGLIFNDKGEVMLTSYKTPNTEIRQSKQQNPFTCSSGI